MDDSAFNYLKELKIVSDKCNEIFKKYGIEDFNELEKKLKAFDIIMAHKLLNYVIKNPKCAAMYGLSEEEIRKLKEGVE